MRRAPPAAPAPRGGRGRGGGGAAAGGGGRGGGGPRRPPPPAARAQAAELRSSLTIFTEALAPILLAPASIMRRAVSVSETPPEALTPIS